jgi:hypothetical protein
MSTHAKALALSTAGLLGCLVATSALAQQAEMKVSRVDTEVDVITLQAGGAYGFDDAALSENGMKRLDGDLARILQYCEMGDHKRQRPGTDVPGRGLSVVAGARFGRCFPLVSAHELERTMSADPR